MNKKDLLVLLIAAFYVAHNAKLSIPECHALAIHAFEEAELEVAALADQSDSDVAEFLQATP